MLVTTIVYHGRAFDPVEMVALLGLLTKVLRSPIAELWKICKCRIRTVDPMQEPMRFQLKNGLARRCHFIKMIYRGLSTGGEEEVK